MLGALEFLKLSLGKATLPNSFPTAPPPGDPRVQQYEPRGPSSFKPQAPAKSGLGQVDEPAQPDHSTSGKGESALAVNSDIVAEKAHVKKTSSGGRSMRQLVTLCPKSESRREECLGLVFFPFLLVSCFHLSFSSFQDSSLWHGSSLLR